MGVDVHRLGVCPTPALSFVTGDLGYGAGIMVSASHNPADDNGLKVLDARGLKLDDQSEDDARGAHVARRRAAQPDQRAASAARSDGRAGLDRYRAASDGAGPPGAHATCACPLDCANGSGGELAPEIIGATGAPDERPFRRARRQQHQPRVRRDGTRRARPPDGAEGSDVGFALDGDADRCVAVDERGQVVDGDQLLGIVALDRLARGALAESTLVVSVLSNGGLAAVGGGSRRPGRADARRRQVHPRRDAGVRAPAWAARRAATSSSGSTPAAATAS